MHPRGAHVASESFSCHAVPSHQERLVHICADAHALPEQVMCETKVVGSVTSCPMPRSLSVSGGMNSGLEYGCERVARLTHCRDMAESARTRNVPDENVAT